MKSWLGLLLVVALATPARADEDVRDLYAKATAHFNLGRYKEAAAEYEHVYELHPDAVLLYDIGQSYRLLGVPDKAIFYYRSYLRNSPKAPNRVEVQGRINDLEVVIQQQQKLQNPPNEPVAPPPNPNATPPTNPPPPETVTPPPPPQQPVATPPTAKKDDRPLYKKWWFWTAIGGGVVVVAVVVGVSVAATQGPSFSPTLPDTGPGVSTTSLMVRF